MDYFSGNFVLFGERKFYGRGIITGGAVESGVIGGVNIHLVQPEVAGDVRDAALYAAWLRSHLGGTDGDGTLNRVILDTTTILFDASEEYKNSLNSLPPYGKGVDEATQKMIGEALSKITLDPNIGAREGFDPETGLAIGLTAIQLTKKFLSN